MTIKIASRSAKPVADKPAEIANVADQPTTPAAVLVVLGLGSDGKPHAARFDQADKALVIKAAGLMGFHAIDVAAGELQATALQLPGGKIFASGRGFVPFIRRDLYDKLVGLAGTEAELKPMAVPGEGDGETKPNASVPKLPPSGHATPARKPMGGAVEKGQVVEGAAATSGANPVPSDTEDDDLWGAVRVGSTVLARDDEAECWYEAVVISIAIDDPNALKLRWRDYPLEALFKMHRHRLAIIGSGAAA